MLSAFNFNPSSVSEIQWSQNKKLTWSDFKGIPDNKAPYYAQSAGSFLYDLKREGKNKVVLTMKVSFDCNKSWVKRGAETDYLLNHEQKHFDIWEAHARYFIRSLKLDTKLNAENFSIVAETHFNETMKKLNKIQENYDTESNHSINTAKQEEWNAKIAKVLKDLDKYAAREVVFTF